MKIPTDKQFANRTESIRRSINDLRRKVDDIKSYGSSITGATNNHHLLTAINALAIAESSLFEIKFGKPE